MDNSNCLEESVDINRVDDNGWQFEDLFERLGVDVKGIWNWNESILGINSDPSIFIFVSL